MTRDEFMGARARKEWLKTHTPTKVQSGEAKTLPITTGGLGSKSAGRRSFRVRWGMGSRREIAEREYRRLQKAVEKK